MYKIREPKLNIIVYLLGATNIPSVGGAYSLWRGQGIDRVKLEASDLPPTRFFLEITNRCNLRCKLCKLWQNTERDGTLNTEDKVRLIRDFSDWLKHDYRQDVTRIPLVFTGGEPFLRPDQVLRLAEEGSRLGFQVYVNTNGVLVGPFLDKLPESGLTAITFSLDSHQPETHDALRGVKGTHSQVVSNIRNLLEERRKHPSSLAVYVQSILGRWNADALEEQVSWTIDLGVDGIMFQCLQYPFGDPIPANWYKSFDYFPSIESVRDAVRTALKIKRETGFIKNAVAEIGWWETYFQYPETLPSGFHPCKGFQQNLIVDQFGNAKFCFNMPLNPIDLIGNVRRDPLQAIWRGSKALNVKAKMAECSRSCGTMVCHCDSEIRGE